MHIITKGFLYIVSSMLIISFNFTYAEAQFNPPFRTQDEGGTSQVTYEMDFVGSGIEKTQSGTKATVTVNTGSSEWSDSGSVLTPVDAGRHVTIDGNLTVSNRVFLVPSGSEGSHIFKDAGRYIINRGATSAGPAIEIAEADVVKWFMKLDFDASNDEDLQFANSSSQVVLHLDQTNAVGINETAPDATLEVGGDTKLAGQVTISGDTLITSSSNKDKDHGHAAQTNPTLFIHSQTDVDSATDQWASLTHDTSDAILAAGKGMVVLDGKTNIVLDADTGSYFFRDNGVDIFKFKTSSGSVETRFASYDAMGNHLILTNGSNEGRNHDHGLQTDPTLFIHSDTDPNTDNTQYVSILHDKTDAIITSGKGSVKVPDGVYLQAEDNNAGAPDSADCDSDTEIGRLSIDTTNERLYVCNGASRGWDYIALTD